MKARRIVAWAAVAAAILGLGDTASAQRGLGEWEGVAQRATLPPVIELRGRIEEIDVAPCEATTGRALAGVHMFVLSDDEPVGGSVAQTKGKHRLNVHLGPAEVLEDEVNDLRKTDREVQVIAFRTEAMEEGHYVARSIRIDEKTTLELRDENLRPLWAGGFGEGRVRARDFAPGGGRGRGGGGMGMGQGAGRGLGRQGRGW